MIYIYIISRIISFLMDISMVNINPYSVFWYRLMHSELLIIIILIVIIGISVALSI